MKTKNPFRHHAHSGNTLEAPRTPEPATASAPASAPSSDPASATDPGSAASGAHPWHHMQQDVDPDCVRDPGSDLMASWSLEHAAAEEALEQDRDQERDQNQHQP